MQTPLRLLIVLELLAFMAALTLGCTGTGALKEGEQLYTGAKVHISKSDKDWSTKLLKTDLKKAVILPRPNKKILWMRPRLVIYHIFQNERENSAGNFIANQFGEAPVLYQPKIANRQRELLTERAANDGYFKTKITSTENAGTHTVKLHYAVEVRSPREIIDKVLYPPDSSTLTRTISTMRPKTLVEPGKPYQLEALMLERMRINDTLRNHGWYYFSPDNLLFEADTLHPPGDMTLTLRVKPTVTNSERQRYRLATITI
jgi:hypothetical protein